MLKLKIIWRVWFISILVLATPLPTQAQQETTITGQGVFADEIAFTLTFNPAGGPVTGSTKPYMQKGDLSLGAPGYSYALTTNYPACNIIGNFEGGDGGKLQATLTCVGQTKIIITTPVGTGNTAGTSNLAATFTGTLGANGLGTGTSQISFTTALNAFTMNGINYPASTSPPQTATSNWKLTYKEADFKAALAPPTIEYFQDTYGLTLEVGDAEWKPDELRWLDQLLKELPEDFRQRLALQKLIRYQAGWNENWQTKPDVFGDFSPVDQRDCPGCARSGKAIRVYDHASSPYDFKDPATQFKGTLLHEMAHALATHENEAEKKNNVYDTSILQNFMNATRPKPQDPIYQNGWGWGYINSKTKAKEWRYYGSPTNKAPTDYAYTNPQEDLSESTMLYLYDPKRLQASSPQRYKFIRDQLFKGVEYENGQQKNP